jgi:hypothetical protein
MALHFQVNFIGNDGEVAPSANSEHILEEVSNLSIVANEVYLEM